MSIELFLGIIGTIIAMGVAITTVWQGFLTRKHNRLSVKPLLRIDRNSVPGQKIRIALTNTGVGPAIIKSIKYFVDGVLVDPNIEKYEERVLEKINQGAIHYQIYKIFTDESFSVGENRALYESLDVINENIKMNNLKSHFDRISVEVEYESIYGEKFKINNSSNQHST